MTTYDLYLQNKEDLEMDVKVATFDDEDNYIMLKVSDLEDYDFEVECDSWGSDEYGPFLMIDISEDDFSILESDF